MAASNEEEEDEIISKHLTQQVEYLSIINDTSTVCANCGKEGSNLNVCNKCKAATYCNASCKKKHRHKHKEACERRVAELHKEELERKKRAAELHDKKLFKQPPPKEDCPICMLPLPSLFTGLKYRACCGKMICSGCIHAVEKQDGGIGRCPFCRTPTPTAKEMIEQMKKRMEIGDAKSIYEMGCYYYHGRYGLPQDHNKTLDLWHRAAELGYAPSYYNIGNAYYAGNGVERDMKKANHYYELAAMGGVVEARLNLGVFERRVGNMNRALKHDMISAGVDIMNLWRISNRCIRMGERQKMTTPTLYYLIKHTWLTSRVLSGIKLQPLMTSTNITNANLIYLVLAYYESSRCHNRERYVIVRVWPHRLLIMKLCINKYNYQRLCHNPQ